MLRCPRLLAALILTALGCRGALPARPAPTPAPIPAERSAACGLDEVRESFCASRRSAAACGSTARDEDTFQAPDVLPSTHLVARLPSLATFTFDTKRRTASEAACCFERCTRLEVCAVHRPVPNEPSADPPVDGAYSSRDVCIAPPEGGTSIPADANEACPAAVLFHGRGLRRDWWNDASPYIGDSNGKCCYRVAFVSQW